MDKINVVDACLGEIEGLKHTADKKWISNGVWAAHVDTFSANTARKLVFKSAEIVDNDRFNTVAPTMRKSFKHTPLLWDAGEALITCFVADDGARVWIDSRYVTIFGLEEVFGDNTGPVVNGDKSWSILFAPFLPPDDDACAALVLRDVGIIDDGTDFVEEVEKQRMTSKQAVAASLPDPKQVAASTEKSPDLCESVDCRVPRLGSSRWCKTHTAEPAENDAPKPRCHRKGCLYIVEAVTNPGDTASDKLCHGHASEARSASVKETKPARKASPAPVADNSGEDWI